LQCSNDGFSLLARVTRRGDEDIEPLDSWWHGGQSSSDALHQRVAMLDSTVAVDWKLISASVMGHSPYEDQIQSHS
jgi:hypothetical protein